jgi:glycosyltransferase involved in cell wall biosynthesis
MSTENRKLIYILNSYSDEDASHFTHVLHLLEVMAAKGCEIVLIVEKVKSSLPVMGHPRIKVHGLKETNRFCRYLELRRALCVYIECGYLVTFVRIAAGATIVASLVNWRKGGKCFLWQSGTTHEIDWARPVSLDKFRWWLTSYVPNWMARKVVQRFVTGPESMVDYYTYTVGVDRNKIRLLYNDIDLARFGSADCTSSKASFLAKMNKQPDCTILLLVHRLSPVRRTLLYLEAMLKELRDTEWNDGWVLVVAGGGSELKAAKKLVSTLNFVENVHFLGEVPNKTIHELYQLGDIFVHPTYTEGFPRVLIEAMATGLPVVTTDAGGTSQLIGVQQKAFMSPKSDPQKFAKNLKYLMNCPEYWAELGNENRRLVQKFSTESVASMYIRTLFNDTSMHSSHKRQPLP